MPYPKKKRTSKLVFSVQIQEKKIMFSRNFFTYINKNETEEKEFSMGFFPIQCDKKEKKKMYVSVHKQQRQINKQM
jgi:hypothetical protein